MHNFVAQAPPSSKVIDFSETLSLYNLIMRSHRLAQKKALEQWQSLNLADRLDIQLTSARLWPNDLSQSQFQSTSILVLLWAQNNVTQEAKHKTA